MYDLPLITLIHIFSLGQFAFFLKFVNFNAILAIFRLLMWSRYFIIFTTKWLPLLVDSSVPEGSWNLVALWHDCTFVLLDITSIFGLLFFRQGLFCC